jgi:hypothetical protein
MSQLPSFAGFEEYKRSSVQLDTMGVMQGRIDAHHPLACS